MLRRVFIEWGLMLVGLGRRAWAQDSPFAPLTRPVAIPLEQVAIPWRVVPFAAEGRAPASGGSPDRRVLMTGVLFRRRAASVDLPATADDLSALCLTCPHEQCVVDLITEPAQLVKMTGSTTQHPLFECGCHFSVFDAAKDGARMAGETPRGLYRFRISGIKGGQVEISDIEAEALTAV